VTNDGIDRIPPETPKFQAVRKFPHHGLRILIADDHRMVAEVICDYLVATESHGFTMATTLEETLFILREKGPFDIVMLDYRMPGMMGIESVEKVVAAALPGKVVLFSAHVDNYTLNRALKCGVRGLITKFMPLVTLGRVLALVDSGELFIPAGETINREEADRLDSLTDLERFILAMAARGATNKQIAEECTKSEALIKAYMRTICRKLGARNRAHAALLGRDMDLFV
jgi:two-component system, NarL family, nitrate/nitrite response regulator NarL